jgi:hypothetical protein
VLDFRGKQRLYGFSGLGHRPTAALVALTVVVLLGVGAAVRPGRLSALLAEPPTSEDARGERIDTRLHKKEPLGVFVSPLGGGAADGHATNETSEFPSAERQVYFRGVRPDYLSVVRDDTVLVSKENDAWFHLFDVLDHASERDLQAASEGELAYVQLYNQPRAYRGKLVSLSGRLRSAEHLSSSKNSYGVESYYKLAIEVGSGGNPPVVIAYVLELPDGIENRKSHDGSLSESIRLTGFFFKRLAYKAQDTIRLAPLMAAKTVEWTPEPAAPTTADQNPITAVARSTLVAIVLLGLVWFAIRRSVARVGSKGQGRGFVIRSRSAERSSLTPDEFLRSLAGVPVEGQESSHSKAD